MPSPQFSTAKITPSLKKEQKREPKPHRFGFLKTILFTLIILTILAGLIFGVGEVVTRMYVKFSPNQTTAVNLEIFQPSRYMAWEHKPMSSGFLGEGSPPPLIEINSIGLRNAELEEPKTKKRILFLGDSFTFGMGVDQEKTLPYQFNRMMGRDLYEMVNAGAIGYTTDDEYMWLKEKGMKLKPDAVVLGLFVGNDITEFRRHNWITDAKGDLERVVDTEHEIVQSKLRRIGEKEPDWYFWNLLHTKWQIVELKMGWREPEKSKPTLTWPVFLPADSPYGDPKIEEYWKREEQMLSALEKLCREANVPLIVLPIPMDVQVNRARYDFKYPGAPLDAPNFDMDRPQKRLREISVNRKWLYVDPLEMLRMRDRSEATYFLSADGHWTKFGVQAVGWELKNAFYDLVKAKKL